MNTHYVVPGTIALALHAVVFFGFGRSLDHRNVMSEPASRGDIVHWTNVSLSEDEIIEEPEAFVCALPAGPISRPRVVLADYPLPSVNFESNGSATPVFDSVVQSRWIEAIPGCGFPPVPVAALDRDPNARSQTPPEYPHAAKAKGLTGEVLVKFLVDTTGCVHDAVVVRSTDRIFEEAAVRAILRWRFEPGKHD